MSRPTRPDHAGQREADPRPAPAQPPPTVWILTEARPGDDIQVRRIARDLGWESHELPLVGNSTFNVVLDRIVDAMGLERPPIRLPEKRPETWPDVVLGVTGRSVSTARRIARASGGRAKLVQLGRPAADLRDFDLIITTPQYGLPDHEKLVRIPLPLREPRRSAPTSRAHSPSPTARSRGRRCSSAATARRTA